MIYIPSGSLDRRVSTLISTSSRYSVNSTYYSPESALIKTEFLPTVAEDEILSDTIDHVTRWEGLPLTSADSAFADIDADGPTAITETIHEEDEDKIEPTCRDKVVKVLTFYSSLFSVHISHNYSIIWSYPIVKDITYQNRY